MPGQPPRILLTGATGYVGGRLLLALEQQGHPVRCLVRRPDNLRAAAAPGREVLAGDVLAADSLTPAMRGIDTAYYLVHALAGGRDFVQEELQGARNFARAAREAGVKRVVYLGGLVPPGEPLSEHLASRLEVGRILREEGPPCCELRASIIIGSGSLSFEMIRALVQKLPVMVMPSWTRRLSQPIAIGDVIAYLLAARTCPLAASRVVEIGGPETVSYADLMRIFAEERGLRRTMLPVPWLSPGLSSHWLALVTPLQARVGAKLIDSIRHDTVVDDPASAADFDVEPRGVRESVRRAIQAEDQSLAATRWSDALSSSQVHRAGYGGVRYGSRLLDSREIRVPVPPPQAFAPIRRIGGRTGWYYGQWLWRVRGVLDKLAGGPGLRRGRRDPEQLSPGDAVDFWRVRRVEPDRLLRLRAEMLVPGRAWLQFEVEPDGPGSRIRQTAIFDPRGSFGLLYWYLLWPFHQFVFGGMLREIGRRAREGADPPA
ncbi:MAG: SDR family oxidoreductase [Candidatus Krumholzibacteriia bacterium]